MIDSVQNKIHASANYLFWAYGAEKNKNFFFPPIQKVVFSHMLDMSSA